MPRLDSHASGVGRDRWLRYYTRVAVWLLGALALVAPSGYSIGATLLLLGSPVLLFTRPALGLTRRDWLVIAVLAGYGLLAMLLALSGGLGLRGFDRPVRFLLGVPILLLVMAYPPRRAWLWAGLAVGAIGAGGIAGWQRLIAGVERSAGFLHPIQFGNIGMLMGVLCLAGLGWAVVQRHRHGWVGLLLLGALGGFLASVLSGSRGGWIGLPLMLLVLYRAYGREFSLSGRVTALAGVALMVALAWFTPQTGVQHRVALAVTEVGQYVSGERVDTSVGFRFDMWKGASRLFVDKPLLGWGEHGYQRGMQQLAEEGVIHEDAALFRHAHNEFLDHAAKHGAVGLLALLALYLVPIALFAPGLKAASLAERAPATAGTLLSVAYIDFSLTQGFLSHNSGVMVYTLWLAVLWGSYRARPAPDRGQAFK